MSFFHRILPSARPAFFALLLSLPAAGAAERWAPAAAAGPVNQLEVAGNACGPAALLAAFRCGSERWQATAQRIPGTSDRSKLLYIIRAHGLQPSASLRQRKRWNAAGINAEDLTTIAAELAAIGGQPAPHQQSLLRKNRESPERQLRRLHDHLRHSLKAGFPPVVNLRRHVLRDGPWTVLDGHFVTIVMVPEKLPRRSTRFDFTYFDPWGGKKSRGTFAIPDPPVMAAPDGRSPFLAAEVPDARIGSEKLRPGEISAVVPTIMIGR